jgi:hypothetical protein
MRNRQKQAIVGMAMAFMWGFWLMPTAEDLILNTLSDKASLKQDIFRGTIDNQIWGQTLTSSMLTNGKYYLKSFAIFRGCIFRLNI